MMNDSNTTSGVPEALHADEGGIDLLELATALAQRWRLLLLAPLSIGCATLGVSFLIPPTYTARTIFLPPQQQGSTVAAMASLGALASLSGASVKTTGDQYVSLLSTVNVQDRIVDQFKLMEHYEAKYRFVARKTLASHVRITLGKKDGLITIEADALEPKMAAGIANQYVAELRRLTSELALTEAQQRRVFFEAAVKDTTAKLTEAQRALQSGGFNAEAIKTEPKAAAEAFARIKAEATAAEVKLQTLRRALTENSPEVQQQLTMLSALRGQLDKLEQSNAADKSADAGYIGRYREFKYQEALYEQLSKQYEMARLDESREGAPLQVVDVATLPEYKSAPKRATMAVAATFGSGFLLMCLLIGQFFWRHANAQPETAERLQRFLGAWRRR